MTVLKNGRMYEMKEEEYAWKVFLHKFGSVVVYRFAKKEFDSFDQLENYVKLCVEF